ncbi:MAG: ATP-binding cassette domain-containing protein [Betaproteobacteria bacterium]|nr:ATP-binding cassette domain-containing protein [Betaproteobacteria bacterium]
MERGLFGFIWRYSKREQLLIVPLVIASMVVLFASLDLPKTIVNEPIQGKRFPNPDSMVTFLRIAPNLPEFLGGQRVLLEGFQMDRTGYLVALSITFLALIVVSGLLKLQINTMKGWMGERMLRRLRFALFDHILRFPLPHFRRVKSAEMATMIKDEVEPLGGFIGEAIITPLFLGGQALTALFFILYQHIFLGLIAFGMVVMQAVIIPRMRRRLLVLSKERQITARQLAGRIAECVEGAVEIHAHDTSNYERAEISARLGRMFRIRFELFQRKFMIKFLNNFLSQVTPFLFYLVGGYLAIAGRLDIGTLVAVIAAYKDLPSPIKELIDWDQQRMDVQIKYTQVVEQFTTDDLAQPGLQEMVDAPQLPQQGNVKAANLSLLDESGTKVLDGISFEYGLQEHVAIVGHAGGGGSELAQVLSRLLPPNSGTIEMGGMDITRAPEAVTGRAISYVGSAAYLFPVSVRENLLYGLKHRPVREKEYSGDTLRLRDIDLRESSRAGNSTCDIQADWIDYEAAGVSGAEEMDARILEVLKAVDLEEAIFEVGLKSVVTAGQNPGISDSVLRARDTMRERMNQPGISELVERFDLARFNRNATLAENLLFGTPVGKTFDVDNLAKNAYVRKILEDTGLAVDLLKVGHKLAETMVELFSDLPPGHELFERFSFIQHDDLPQVKDILVQVADVGLDRIDEADRNTLLALPFKLISARHRLGLIDEALEGRILEARRQFAEHLPAEMRGAIEFFDPGKFIGAASLQDNILFGKIVTGQAEGGVRIGRLLRQLLDELAMRPLVVKIGLGFQVGTGGARLPAADRQKIAVGRAILKRPALVILDNAAAVLDPSAQNRLLASVLESRGQRGVFWVLNRVELAEKFDQVIVMDRGKLVERGKFADLKASGGALSKLMDAG